MSCLKVVVLEGEAKLEMMACRQNIRALQPNSGDDLFVFMLSDSSPSPTTALTVFFLPSESTQC